MRETPFLRRLFAVALCGAAVAAVAFVARAGDPPPLPNPPTTPLPTFENPLHDAEVGETLRYVVKDVNSRPPGPSRWFEERVVARTKDQACLETVETDETGARVFSVDPQRSGWRKCPEKLLTGDHATFLAAKEKDEVLYVGDPPTKAIRTRHRFLDEPEPDADPASGPRRVRQIWYSHDVPCSGKAKEFPAQADGERMVISWDRKMTAEECAERAKKFGPAPEPVDEPAMSEPPMSDTPMVDGMSSPSLG
jgi:hypothetical protein